ncbi:MAG TPA: hypothetical protein PKE55_07950 [Kiritimatiellia bacterium]|nr:hypothetical protein [Kiritimatiellia bacterium]
MDGLVIPRRFDDPLHQLWFEREVEVHQLLFDTPRMGTYLQFVRTDGFGIWAYLRGAHPRTVDIMVDDQLMSLPRDRLSEQTLARLYTNDFALVRAQRRVERAIRQGIELTSELPLMALSRPGPAEARLMAADMSEVRLGPGALYRGVPTTSLYRGRQIVALAREGMWILVEDPARRGERLGWIPRFSTVNVRPSDLVSLYEDVELLMEEGLVQRIDPLQNRIWLNGNMWVSTPAASIEGIGRVMSEYIRLKSGGASVRVEFYEAASDQLLASYGAATGLRRVR